MLCNIIDRKFAQTENGNWYLSITARVQGDPFSEPLKYKMWLSEELKDELEKDMPKIIDLERVEVVVEPFMRLNKDTGELKGKPCDKLTVVCRTHKGKIVDNPEALAKQLRKNLIKHDEIIEYVPEEEENDGFKGATGVANDDE